MIRFLERKTKDHAIKAALNGECQRQFFGDLKHLNFVAGDLGLEEIRRKDALVWVMRSKSQTGWCAYRLEDPLVEAIMLKGGGQ